MTTQPQEHYSQRRAMWAICKASLRALRRSPSAIIFSLVFPFIFILVFGFIGSGGPTIRIAFENGSDTNNPVYDSLVAQKNIRVVTKPEAELQDDLEKGRITAIVSIKPVNPAGYPKYAVNVRSSTAGADRIGLLYSVVQRCIGIIEYKEIPNKPVYAFVQGQTVPGREYRTIDFVLPGQLGFSLMSAAVFGIAFMFFNLRQTLVLKRFYATPINRLNIVLGEVMARTIFQLVVTAFILIMGVSFFHYTLVNGVVTFFEMLVLAFIGLILFMGFGFIVSGRAKSDSSIPPFANLITLPQFLLGGTFFSVEAFPTWLQPVSKVLPLTHLNTAMRDIAFEGMHLWNEWRELGVLAIWGVVVYAVAIRTFKWD